jgi:hypothetical protein
LPHILDSNPDSILISILNPAALSSASLVYPKRRIAARCVPALIAEAKSYCPKTDHYNHPSPRKIKESPFIEDQIL